MFSYEALQAALAQYCSWSCLPSATLAAALQTWRQSHAGGSAAAAPEQEQLHVFLQSLAATVPLQWTVEQHSSAKRLASMHARAVGTQHGSLWCFGGMQLGALAELKVQSEVSWLREHHPAQLAPDFSTVYQGASSHSSRQVISVVCQDDAWAAKAAAPQMSAGLIGHSVVRYGSRAFIFGGLETQPAAAAGADNGGNSSKPPVSRTINALRAYAVHPDGTQGGLLPVLTDPLPQLGQLPSSRMYHSAAVDPDAGRMYVFGGVHVRDRDGARLPADSEPGLLHCYDFYSYTWTSISTSGSCRPRSTTLLAFWWQQDSLWAVPGVPLSPGASRTSSSSRHTQCYQLLRLDMATNTWHLVQTQGEPPCLRTDACSLQHNGHMLLVYGGKTARTPCSMLSDLHVLHLDKQPPLWQQAEPRLLMKDGSNASKSNAGLDSSSGSSSTGGGGLLALAGHCGGSCSVNGSECVVFVGGYRRHDMKEPQTTLQVLQVGVKPPTPDAARLSGAAVDPLSFALQHVRLQLARLVRQQHPNQVLLKPDAGGGVRLPARLLALHSCLFDDMFQDMLQQQEEEEEQEGGGQQPQEPQVPVPGVSAAGIAGVCRWMMGLLTLASCSSELLVDMYRVADRLVIERLMIEVLEVLGRLDVTDSTSAAAVLRLTGDLSGRDENVAALGNLAAQQLRQQVSAATAPAIMSLALQLGHKQLQERCVEVMRGHRKNDVWGVLGFACRFGLAHLQGSCLAALQQASRGRLVDRADRVVKVAARYAAPQQPLAGLPVIAMLEKDLLAELAQAEPCSLVSSYAAAAETLGLGRLRQGLVEACGSPGGWQQLAANPNVRQQLQQRFPDLFATIQQRATGRSQPPGPAAVRVS